MVALDFFYRGYNEKQDCNNRRAQKFAFQKNIELIIPILADYFMKLTIIIQHNHLKSSGENRNIT